MSTIIECKAKKHYGFHHNKGPTRDSFVKNGDVMRDLLRLKWKLPSINRSTGFTGVYNQRTTNSMIREKKAGILC